MVSFEGSSFEEKCAEHDFRVAGSISGTEQIMHAVNERGE
jgi:hypothetical protein